MVVKLNGEPLRVTEEEEKEPWYEMIDWTYMTVVTAGTLLMLWVVDYAAVAFMGVHAFPFIKFVGVVLKWLGVY